ncbi:hypothetical protein [Nocardia sp. NPDC003963]
MPDTTAPANPFLHLERIANYCWSFDASDDEEYPDGPFLDYDGTPGDSFDDTLWLLTEAMSEIGLTLEPAFAEDFNPEEPQAGYDLLENGTRIGCAVITGYPAAQPPGTRV